MEGKHTGSMEHRTPAQIRLRDGDSGGVTLPWEIPLGEWDAAEVPLRDMAVGPSRHLVRFVEVNGKVHALKELPARLARKEYEVLRGLENRGLPSVRAIGLIEYEDAAVLVTAYLERSWQYRRLFMQLPPKSKHRERLLEAMAALLVELHRNGVYWGDCSLANTLFTRDGQVLQAHLVDAETSEMHPHLSRGQREMDLEIFVENVAAGLLDVGAHLEYGGDEIDELLEAAFDVRRRYEELWEVIHQERVLSFSDRGEALDRVRQLNSLGFAVDEVHLEPAESGKLRVRTDVVSRTYHSERLHQLTGLAVGEGQARILLGDLESYRRRSRGLGSTDGALARRWAVEQLSPGMEAARAALGREVEPIQAYCDLLEVRWLLSEQAGEDVGTEAALEALKLRALPTGAAAQAALLELYGDPETR